MSVELEVDEEEYRFADRYVAARAWAIAAALVERLPGMRVSQVVDETGTPLLIVHDATEQERVQLDIVAWVLFGASSGRLQHLYWDEVFASRLEDVVERIVAATGLVLDDGSEPRRRVYRMIAQVLADGLADDPGWLAQGVRIAGEWPPETVDALAAFPSGEQVADAALAAALEGREHDEPVLFHEPLWVLRRALEPVVLLDASTGRLHLPDGTWGPVTAGVDTRLDHLDAPPAEAADVLDTAAAFRSLLAEQWACLRPPRTVDPNANLAPIRYGHVLAEAWRIVAAVLDAGAALRVVGPREAGDICRLVDEYGRTLLRLTDEGIVRYGPDPDVLDWWDVFAAPLPSGIPDRLLMRLPVGDEELSAAERGSALTHRHLAPVLARFIDDVAEWRLLYLAPHRWVVVRGLDLVVMVDEIDGEGCTARRCRGLLLTT